MRRLVNLMGFIVAVFMCMSAKNSENITEPDFAFPKKVQSQAVRDLESALSSGNGAGVVNALIRIGTCRESQST